MEPVVMVNDKTGQPRLLSIDWALCVQRVAGNELLAHDFLLHFVNELHVHRKDFKSQWQRNDLHSLEINAHKLHGAACFCGVPKLQKDVAYLENLARNAESIEILHDSFMRLMDSIEEVIHDYTHHVKSKIGISQC